MVFVVVGVAFLVFGGAAVVFLVAEDHGRSPSLWGLAAMFAAGAVAYAAWRWGLQAARSHDEVGFLLVVLLLLAPVATHAALAFLAIQLPPPPGRVIGKSWRVAWLGAGAREADTSWELRLSNRDLVVASAEAPSFEVDLVDLIEARGDGECVRLRWADKDDEQTAVLMVLGGPSTREGRVRQANGIARRISRLEKSARRR